MGLSHFRRTGEWQESKKSPEEFLSKLQQVEVLQGQGMPIANAGKADQRGAAELLALAQAAGRLEPGSTQAVAGT